MYHGGATLQFLKYINTKKKKEHKSHKSLWSAENYNPTSFPFLEEMHPKVLVPESLPSGISVN